MSDVKRVSVEDARRRVQRGEALLVCAYDDETKCRTMQLEGATTLSELRERLPSVRREQEIILYCA